MVFLVALLGLLAAVAWWKLPTIVEWGLTRVLQQQGLSDISLQFDAVNRTQTRISHLGATYNEPEAKLQFSFEKVRLDYSFAQLLLGQIDSLVAAKTDLKIDYQPQPSTDPAAPLPEAGLLLAIFDAVDPSQLPLNTLRIDQIAILHNLASADTAEFEEVALALSLAKIEGGLHTEVRFLNQQRLNLLIDENNGWQLKYFDAPMAAAESSSAPQAPAFASSLRRVADSLSFSADLTPMSARYLLDLAEIEGSQIDFSSLAFNATIADVESGSGLAIASTLAAQEMQLNDAHIQTATVQINLQIEQTKAADEQATAASEPGYEVNFDGNASISSLAISDLAGDDIKLASKGLLSLSEHAKKVEAEEIKISLGKLQYGGDLSLSAASFAGNLNALILEENWQVVLGEQSILSSRSLRWDTTELPKGLDLKFAQPTQLSGRFATAAELPSEQFKIAAEAATGKATVPDRAPLKAAPSSSNSIKLEKTRFDLSIPIIKDESLPVPLRVGTASLQLKQAMLENDQFVTAGSLTVAQLSAQDGPYANPEWHLNNIVQHFDFKKGLLTSRGSVENSKRELHITTTSKHHFARQQGDTQLRFKPIEFNGPKRLNKLVSPLTLPTKLVTGELNLLGSASWAKKREDWTATADVDAQLVDLGGAHEEIYFSGANGQMSLQLYPELRSRSPHSITVNTLDAGIASTDTVIEFSLQPSTLGDLPLIEIQKLQTKTLQGGLSLKPATFDLNRQQYKAILRLENIDLSELVSLHQLEDIEATGRVSGQLPVTIENGQFSIDDGQMQANAPGGTLKYRASDNAVKANKYADTVVQVLKNFNYDVLRADTRYQPDGTLHLKLRLQGNNPDFEKGRAVNLNIDLQQNVLKLFESLRLIEGLNDNLEKRVRDFHQQGGSG